MVVGKQFHACAVRSLRNLLVRTIPGFDIDTVDDAILEFCGTIVEDFFVEEGQNVWISLENASSLLDNISQLIPSISDISGGIHAFRDWLDRQPECIMEEDESLIASQDAEIQESGVLNGISGPASVSVQRKAEASKLVASADVFIPSTETFVPSHFDRQGSSLGAVGDGVRNAPSFADVVAGRASVPQSVSHHVYSADETSLFLLRQQQQQQVQSSLDSPSGEVRAGTDSIPRMTIRELHRRYPLFANVEWRSTGSAVSEAYSQGRQDAKPFMSERNRCYTAAVRAYRSGNKKLARDLSREGRCHSEMMLEEHENAGRALFEERNPMDVVNETHCIDLHCQHVSNAVLFLNEALLEARRRQWQEMLILTGSGHHSKSNVGRGTLRDGILGWLLDNGYRSLVIIKEPGGHEGSILVRI